MTLNQLKYAVVVAGEHSLNDAAKKLFISQPSLSNAIHSLEQELGFNIFNRSKTGVTVTQEGVEFIGYARQVLEQYELLDARYISRREVKKKFSVSTQHYTFAVNAFIETMNYFGMDRYEFGIYEDTTYQVIDNVKNHKSELGILYINEFNQSVLGKLFQEYGLVFHPLFDCGLYVYLWKGHPLADQEQITMEELMDYPCLSFDQGEHNSFYFAEEVLSTYQYKKIIKASDRATLLNLMVGSNGYTLCSGIICEELNGSDYAAVRLDSQEQMTIGYISRKDAQISEIGKKYIEEIEKFRDKAML